MWGLVIGAVKGFFSAAMEPVNEWQKRKSAKVANQFELDRLDHEANLARANASVELAKTGQVQDYNLDRISQKNMQKSWKDEYLLIELSIPLIMAFIPSFQDTALKGFNIIEKMPAWYIALYVGMAIAIYGLRGLSKSYLNKEVKESK